MVRRISGSTPQESSAAEDSDLARWLTRELRVKGAPLQPEPPSEPDRSSPPTPDAHRSMAPGRSRRAERESLGTWLARDLIPKRSGRLLPAYELPASETPALRREPFLKEPARAEPAEARGRVTSDAERPSRPPPARSAPALGRERPSLSDVVPSLDARPGRPPALDSHSRSGSQVPPAPNPSAGRRAPPATNARLQEPPANERLPVGDVPSSDGALTKSDPPSAITPSSLDEDDLAVLPGRRRASGTRRAKLALALLLALIVIGSLIVVRFGAPSADDARASASDRPPGDNGVLLPPPPSSDEVPSVSEPAPAPPVARRPSASAADSDEPMDPSDPRWSLGGPNVRRYADVPSPTLSRLAREQRRLARERDEAMRNAKATASEPEKAKR